MKTTKMNLKQFWECEECYGLLEAEIGVTPRCDYCCPLEAISVSSEEFNKDVSKYVKISRDRTVRVISGTGDNQCVMSMGSPSKMR